MTLGFCLGQVAIASRKVTPKLRSFSMLRSSVLTTQQNPCFGVWRAWRLRNDLQAASAQVLRIRQRSWRARVFNRGGQSERRRFHSGEDFAEGFFVGEEGHSEVVLVVDVERGPGATSTCCFSSSAIANWPSSKPGSCSVRAPTNA